MTTFLLTLIINRLGGVCSFIDFIYVKLFLSMSLPITGELQSQSLKNPSRHCNRLIGIRKADGIENQLSGLPSIAKRSRSCKTSKKTAFLIFLRRVIKKSYFYNSITNAAACQKTKSIPSIAGNA